MSCPNPYFSSREGGGSSDARRWTCFNVCQTRAVSVVDCDGTMSRLDVVLGCKVRSMVGYLSNTVTGDSLRARLLSLGSIMFASVCRMPTCGQQCRIARRHTSGADVDSRRQRQKKVNRFYRNRMTSLDVLRCSRRTSMITFASQTR